jgi:2-hydroxycyclohexanecarboxyl-CoA dehydrogenase
MTMNKGDRMEMGLRGKSVIVTGGTANAGRATVLAFAREGARVVVAARDVEAGARVVERALDEGAMAALWVKTDVLDADRVEHLVAEVIDKFGEIDVLVNNVGGGGIVEDKPFWETSADDWKVDIDMTLTSVLNCSRAVLQHMVARGRGGRIINIGSTSGLTGDPGMAVYSAAKGAVHAFTRVLAREVADHGVTVNVVAPWGIMPEDAHAETSTGSRWNPATGKFALLGVMDPARTEEWKNRTLLGVALDRPMVKPREVAEAAVYLASTGASFITGQVLVIDGGLMLKQP